VTPADRLAARYELFDALGGQAPPATVGDSTAPPRALEPATGLSASEIIERLDAAPGLDAGSLSTQARLGEGDPAARLIAAILATPHYQLA